MDPNSLTTLGDNDQGQIGEDVFVRKPLQQGEGRVTYLVETGTVSIRRRYSDFTWLYKRLQTELPGAFVPIIPHTRTFHQKEFDSEFLETRRTNLERFLKGVFVVPEARAVSKSLLAFLKASNLETAKKIIEVNNPSILSDDDINSSTNNDGKEKVAKGITNLFAKAKTLTQTTFGNIDLEETEDEEDVNALKEYVTKMARHTKEMLMASAIILKTTSDKAVAMGAFAAPVAELKFSRDDYFGRENDWIKPMGHALIHTAQVSKAAGTILKEQHIQELVKFEHGLQLLALDIKAFQVALQTRRSLQVTFTTRGKQIADKEAAIQNPGKRNVDKLKGELVELERNKVLLGQRLNDCSERIVKEATRVLPQMDDAFQVCLEDFCKIQMDSATRLQESWTSLFVGLSGNNRKRRESSSVVANGESGAVPPIQVSHQSEENTDENSAESRMQTVRI